jgi:hypothetical protein
MAFIYKFITNKEITRSVSKNKKETNNNAESQDSQKFQKLKVYFQKHDIPIPDGNSIIDDENI